MSIFKIINLNANTFEAKFDFQFEIKWRNDTLSIWHNLVNVDILTYHMFIANYQLYLLNVCKVESRARVRNNFEIDRIGVQKNHLCLNYSIDYLISSDLHANNEESLKPHAV